MSAESPANFADLIPLAEDSDPEEVVTALETAQVFAARDPREALRWLRRAAEAADDAGRDNRSLALSRTAAELANHLASAEPPAAPSQPVAPAPPPSRAAEAEAESVVELTPSMRPPPPSQRRSSMPTPPPKPSIRPAPPSAASAPAPENLTPPPPSVTSRAPAKPTSSLTPSPTRSVGKSLPPEKPSKPSRAPLSPSATPAAPSVVPAAVSRPSVVPAAVSRPPPKPTYTTPQALLGSEGSQVIERLMREGRAETVSVKRSARDPSLFVVRTGAAQGIGSRRALIVLLEDDADFFSDQQPDFAN